MENRRVARFFVETLIGEQVEDIATVPQEYTYLTKVYQGEEDKESYKERKKGEGEVLSVIRFDFVATIRTTNGEHKKVLIEIQKSKKPADLVRFRTYLGEQYKKTDMVEVVSGKVEKALPIISIYLLGFTIPKIKAKAIKVGRTYIDMIGQTEIKQKSSWIEALTHDGYFVQIPHIKGKPRTLLEKLLSVFEQQYFIDDKNTIKDYEYPIDDDNVKKIIELLRHAAADSKTKREMEEAWWAEKNEELWENEIKKGKKVLEENKKALEEKDKFLAEKDKSLAEKDKSLAEKDREIAELKRLYGINID
jgi:hypothetical protein